MCVDDRFLDVLDLTKDSNNNTDGTYHDTDKLAPGSITVEKDTSQVVNITKNDEVNQPGRNGKGTNRASVLNHRQKRKPPRDALPKNKCDCRHRRNAYVW